MLYFVNDYSEGAHEKILQHLIDTNMEQLAGYGMDHYCESAKEKIKKACGCEDAEVFLLTGGTQTNQIVIDTLLQPYEGVVAAQTGHVSTHEAGAIEFTGHKVLELPQKDGKICAADSSGNWQRDFMEMRITSIWFFRDGLYFSSDRVWNPVFQKRTGRVVSRMQRIQNAPVP